MRCAEERDELLRWNLLEGNRSDVDLLQQMSWPNGRPSACCLRQHLVGGDCRGDASADCCRGDW
jgi:hypothetical protein